MPDKKMPSREERHNPSSVNAEGTHQIHALSLAGRKDWYTEINNATENVHTIFLSHGSLMKGRKCATCPRSRPVRQLVGESV